jgi:hypothetical protein
MLQRVRAGTALAFIARKWTKILFSRRFGVLAAAAAAAAALHNYYNYTH